MQLLDFWRAESVRFDAVLFDIDGTLVVGPRLLPGAAELISLLRHDGTPFFFLTNDGDHTRRQKCGFLLRAGIEAEEREVISCLSVLPELARRNGWERGLFFRAGRLGDTGDLELTSDPARLEECSAVLMGEGPYDWRTTWEALIDFFRHHPERPFIVPNPDTCWPNALTGGIGIGAGGQARCIRLLLHEMGTEIEPIYLGKPYRAIYDYAAGRLGVTDRSRILCVGDSLASDIRGANNAGMYSALVLTGITSEQQAQQAFGEFRPRGIFSAIGQGA